MKRILISLAAAAMIMTGCQVTGPEENNVTPKETFRLTAEISPSSRTTFTPDGYKVDWDEDDALSVIALETGEYSGYRFYRSASSGDNVFESQDFELTENTEEINVIYPYSENLTSISDGRTNASVIVGSEVGESQSQNGNNPGANVDAPLYGYLEIPMGGGDTSVKMSHATSLIEVNVTNSTSSELEITNITLSTDTYRNLTGEFLLNPQNGDLVPENGYKVASEASLDITGVTLSEDESGKFYITVAPFSLEEGEHVNVYVTANGTRMLFPKTMTEARDFLAGTVNHTSVKITALNTISLDRGKVAYDFIANPEPEQVTLVVTPSSASGLTWTTSDKYVVTVDNGALTPVGHGKAVVTVTDESGAVAECTVTVNGVKDLNYGNGDEYYNKVYLPVNIEVTGADGQPVVQTWLDRNLGASRVAESADDQQAYGSHFQWSRKADGHEQVTWGGSSRGTHVNMNLEAVAVADRSDAGTDSFLKISGDWAADAESDLNGLWGGSRSDISSAASYGDVTQENNPCPAGYRVPSAEEIYLMFEAMLDLDEHLEASMAEAVVKDGLTDILAGCALHIPMCGFTNLTSPNSATAAGLNAESGYWCNSSGSNTNNTHAKRIHIRPTSNSILTGTTNRATGYAVRCIRDTALPTVSLE